MPLVVHYWADLQSVHGLRCYGNIIRTRNVSEYMRVIAVCLVDVITFLSCTSLMSIYTFSPKRSTCRFQVYYSMVLDKSLSAAELCMKCAQPITRGLLSGGHASASGDGVSITLWGLGTLPVSSPSGSGEAR